MVLSKLSLSQIRSMLPGNIFLRTTIAMGMFLTIIAGGYIWSADIWIQIISSLFFTILSASYIIYRWRRKSRLPFTHLEWGLLLYFFSFLVSLITSRYISSGIWRLISAIDLGIIFYCLTDLFEDKNKGKIFLEVLQWVSGVVLLLAVFEIDYAYRQYWMELGKLWIMPPTPYRVTGILGHANALMAFLNLSAPITLISFLESKKPKQKALLMVWGVLYIFVTPFTSSRGGWVGAVAWILILGLGLLIRRYPWKALSEFIRQKRKWVIPLVIFGIVIVLILGYLFVMKFAGYRLSNANPFSGRSEMWESGLRVWKASPWLGVGPGRFPMEILKAVDNIPPKYWPSHAHNLFINALAEFGIVGLLVELTLIIIVILNVKRIRSHISDQSYPIFIAIVASMVGLLIQMIVDDFMLWMAVMVPLVILLAVLYSLQERPMPRFKKISMSWLLIPLLVSTGLSGWRLWTYWPMASAMNTEIVSGRMQAEFISSSSERDGNQSFFLWQAGLAWAKDYDQTKDPSSLEKSIDYLEKFLVLEPEFSLGWANLGILYGYDDPVKSVEAFENAIELAPKVAAYHLNLGIRLEAEMAFDRAAKEYLSVLELEPSWDSDSFWNANTFRSSIIGSWVQENPEGNKDQYWNKALDIIGMGSYDPARELIANGRWIGEARLPLLVAEAILTDAKGDEETSNQILLLIRVELQKDRLISTNSFAETYSLWIDHMVGFPEDLVPGFIQLYPDYGQSTLLEQ